MNVIDTVVSLFIPLSLLLIFVLIFHRILLDKIGVINVYRLWLIIPVGLIAYSLPIGGIEENQVIVNEIKRVVVFPMEAMQQQFTNHWLVYCWLATSILMLAYWIMTHVVFNRQLNLQELPSSELADNCRTLILPNTLKIYQSRHAYSPMLLGFTNQKLVIPVNFWQLYNQEQQQLILEHEICHFDRNDIYWNLIAYCFISLFWFHPLVWLAYFRFRRDQELSCDQLVLARKQVESRVNYSKALLVAAQSAPPFAFAQLSFKKYGDREIMFERIKQIKLNTKASKISVSLAAIVSIGLLSGLSYAGSISEHKANEHHRVPPKAKETVSPVIRVEPKYPIKAVEEKIEGAVVLKFDVDTDGSVKNVDVMNGVPAYVFDRVAVTALKQWKYQATGKYFKNQLVQLDFRLDKNSTFKDVDLIEKIKVTH